MASKKGRVRAEDGPKRIRIYLGGQVVADTYHPKLVWESPYYPQYYIPIEDVNMELLAPTDHTSRSPSRGEANHFTVTAGDRTAENAAWQYSDSPIEELRGHIRFEWDAMDNWFEEDEEVFVHPRDPYKRVDIVASSRHVEVKVNGTIVADTTHPTLLFETGLPTRYYLPKTDVRLDLLEPSDLTTQCPYKGTANYHSVRTGDEVADDIVWYYAAPVHESATVAGLLSFYNEKVEIIVDGEPEVQPTGTPWA
jgi:uncharacterized protein (DUF427 family)